MRHRVDTFKIGRTSAHRRALVANMASSLFFSGRIETTLVKAKAVRRFAERMITLGKQGTLHSRRLAAARMHDENAVKKLFEEIAPAYTGRQGGYTRILKLGQRRGDAAETCLLMLVEPGEVAKKEAAAEEAQA